MTIIKKKIIIDHSKRIMTIPLTLKELKWFKSIEGNVVSYNFACECGECD